MIIELEDMYGNTIFAFRFDESDVENMKDFEECYDGDAKAEVLMFLESLPLHIYRLTLLYSKLGDFVTITAQSLFNSDIGMVNNMEG